LGRRMNMLTNLLSVGLGGAIGACLRYAMGLIPLKSTGTFPWMTILINVLGSFCIGVIAFSVLKYNNLSPKTVLFLKTGLCGGFTTFSTFSIEAYTLFQGGRAGLGVLYLVLSVVLGLLAVFCAFALVSALPFKN